jgi:acetylornithine deacetylase/succinyl-diaminopimelate desuccinylase-like protein
MEAAPPEEAVRYLSELLQIQTTYPPGNELQAAEYLAAILRAEGFEPLVLESTPGRGQVVARLKGDGSQPPLLLFSHTDVVPAEPEKWTHPPFSGAIQDGYIWGRGALDMKSIVIMHLMVMLSLKRTGTPLARDIIFAATADEERAGFEGMGWLVDHHPDLIRAEYALSEFGGFPLNLGGRQVFLCQTGEKGYITLRMRARGRPGHGAIPHDNNAIACLAQCLALLEQAGLPGHVTPTARAFIETVATVLPGVAGSLQNLLEGSPPSLTELRRLLGSNDLAELLNAMLRNTASPTYLHSDSGAVNVVPSLAEAILDGRILPGFDRASLLAELHAVLGSLAEGVEYEPIYEGIPLEFSLDTLLMRTIRTTLRRYLPTAALAPYLLPGSTDAKHVARLGTICYGFAPIQLNPNEHFLRLVHGHDERIAITSLLWGTQLLTEIVTDFCRAG